MHVTDVVTVELQLVLKKVVELVSVLAMMIIQFGR